MTQNDSDFLARWLGGKKAVAAAPPRPTPVPQVGRTRSMLARERVEPAVAPPRPAPAASPPPPLSSSLPKPTRRSRPSPARGPGYDHYDREARADDRDYIEFKAGRKHASAGNATTEGSDAFKRGFDAQREQRAALDELRRLYGTGVVGIVQTVKRGRVKRALIYRDGRRETVL